MRLASMHLGGTLGFVIPPEATNPELIPRQGQQADVRRSSGPWVRAKLCNSGIRVWKSPLQPTLEVPLYMTDIPLRPTRGARLPLLNFHVLKQTLRNDQEQCFD